MSVELVDVYQVVGIGVGVIATAVNLTLFWRNRPDRLKIAIGQALEPLEKRLSHLETSVKVTNNEIGEQAKTLMRIESDLRHMPTQDTIDKINERMGEMSENIARQDGLAQAHRQLMDRFQQAFMQVKKT